METPTAQTPVLASLPDIALSDLPEATKDFIIAHSASGKSVKDVIVEILDHAAASSGFLPHKAA